MNRIKFGSFESEQKVNKYFSIIIERPDYDVTIKTGAVIYPYSVNLLDVTEHNWIQEHDSGSKCPYSPTGFCSQYEAVRWNNMNFPVSYELVARILIERIEKCINLMEEEKEAILNSINNEETFTEDE